MYKVIMQYENESPSIVNEFKTLKEATECLNRITQTAEKDHCIITKTDKYRYTIQDNLTLTFDEVWIEKDDKNKSQNNQQLTLFTNNQNQKTMPTERTSQKKGTQGNPYQTNVKGKPYMKVPEKMVTLPKGNAFITARKHLELETTYVDKNGNTRHNMAVYVLGYSNLNGKTQSGKTRRHWFVARQINVGGTPKLALYRYSGYDRSLARRVFMEIPCTESFWLKRKQHQGGEWEERWVEGNAITAKEVVAAKVKSRARYRENNNPWQSPRHK